MRELGSRSDLRASARRSAALLACAIALPLSLPPTVSGASGLSDDRATRPPAVAYHRGSSVQVADAAGGRVATFPDLSDISLGGRLLTGTRFGSAWRVLGYDSRTGARRFSVRSGVQPTVLDPAGRAAFWATAPRDPQNNSVWMREVDGSVHRVVQFSNGGALPGYDAGFDGDGTILSTSFDRDGNVIALTQGNDTGLFEYDVFTVDVATGTVDRITANRKSRWAAVSPSGSRIVWQREVGTCGAPYIRAAQLIVARIDGSDRRVVAKGSCSAWLGGARWVSSREVVAYVTRLVSPGKFTSNLVLVDVITGLRTKLTRSGVVRYFSADPGSNRIAFSRSGVGGFAIIDLDGGDPVRVRKGSLPHLSGDRATL